MMAESRAMVKWMVTYLIMMTRSGVPVERLSTFLIPGLLIGGHDDMERSSSGVSDNLPDPWTPDR